jgi:drug/metabolite transporter (DMT)-like permease
MDGRRSLLLGSLVVATSASLFGMLGVLSRTAYGLGLTPFVFVAWRAGIGAVATGAFVLWRVRRGGRLVGWRSLDRGARTSLAVAALLGAVLNLAMFLALARTPVAIVLLCFYIYPAIVAGASVLLGWEALDRSRAVALAAAIVGMVAVVVGGPSPGEGGVAGAVDPLGVGLALSAGVSQAIFVLVSRHGYRAVPTDQAMGAILGVSALVAAGLAVVGGGGAALLTAPLVDPRLLGLLLFTGLFGAAIPSFLFLAGIRWIGAVRSGILMLLEPLVAVALAGIFLAEAVGPVQAAGGLAILVAATILQRAQPAEGLLMPAGEPEPDPEAAAPAAEAAKPQPEAPEPARGAPDPAGP